MSVIVKYYKNSTFGYLLEHIYSTEIHESDSYFKNGKSCDKEELKGCIPIKKEKYERELKWIKKQSKDN